MVWKAAAICAMAAMSVGSPASQPVTFYVARNGNDAWTGRLPSPNKRMTDGPFAGISRARDAARGLGSAGPARVLIRAGTYRLSEPLVFTPEDSGVAYQAYPGEKPVISGSRPTGGWSHYKGQIWRCKVPKLDASGPPVRHLFYRGNVIL